MSFEDETSKRVIFLYLPRRSMLCISEAARNFYKHGIFAHHVIGRRISITIRESSELFKVGTLNILIFSCMFLCI